MPVIEFPYSFHKGYLMPIIPVTILGHKIWAYVDSGATYSIFNAKEADRLGINPKDSKCRMIVVGDGSFIPVYFHNLLVHIADISLKVPIGFSEKLGVGFNLLGRKGLFEHFKICFSDRKRKITLQIE